MEDNLKSVSTDLFYKVRSRFSGLKLGAETGEVTINPEEAVFFDFDYMEGENPLGHVSISLAEPSSMKVYYSAGITEEMNPVQKNGWYDFLRGLREFAKRRLMNFDTRDITKDNLDKRDFAFLSQYANNSPLGESVMKAGMYGSSKTSYQKLENTTLIIKHGKQVDETSPGARARNISGLFIENSQGERFKYPFIHLAGARAMQRHVQEGGLPYDELGKHIISMSEQIAQLKSFGNYVARNDLMNSETNGIVERSNEALDRLREEVKHLARKNYYTQYRESFTSQIQEEVPEDVIEDLTSKFTVRNFNEDMKAVFPLIYSLMKTETTNLGYDDVVAMTSQDEVTNEDVEEITTEDDFARFETWVMGLGEESAIQSQDEDEKREAVKELQSLVGQHFPAGTDGENAILSLKGIIEDPELYNQIKNQAKEDSDSCVRPLIKNWLEQNAPDVVGELDFGDMVEPGAEEQGMEEPQADEVPQEAIDKDNPRDYERPAIDRKKSGQSPLTMKDVQYKDDKPKRDFEKRKERLLNMSEVAEFIGSFYDRETGQFPKGEEGVCTMVGKKFGERAEHIARKMVERIAIRNLQNQEAVNENPDLERIRRLAGM